MSTDLSIENVKIPVKRIDGETLKSRMSDNAWNNLMPARYIRQDVDGNNLESHEEVFERVAKNVALGDIISQLEQHDVKFEVSPDQIKDNHAKRDEVAEEVFGDGVSADDATPTVELTEENLYNFSYDNLIDELPKAIAEEVKETKDTFEEKMTHLNFIPNTPTIMNAGNELQQLSACFVLSPEDSMRDIHSKVADAADIFQSGGGCGYGFWKLRPYGDPVGSMGGVSSGPMTFMNTYDQMCETVAQGGARRGAQMGIMRVSHPDVIAFIHAKNKDVSLANCLRLNDPDDYTHNSFGDALEEARELIEVDEDGNKMVPKHLRNAVEGNLSNFNISVGITNDFMEAVFNDEEYTFTNPRTGEAHIATEETKEMYGWFGLGDEVTVGEELSVPAREIWDRMIEGAHENGEPGVIFLERANEEHSFDVEENPEYRINATNPCVTGDTRIATESGLLKAEDLYESGIANSVTVASEFADEVTKEASSVFKTGTDEDVLEITTADGYSVTVTPDHKLYTDEGWKQAKDISEQDTLHLLDRNGVFGRYGSYNDGVLTGILANTNSEGVTDMPHSFTLGTISTDVPNSVQHILEQDVSDETGQKFTDKLTISEFTETLEQEDLSVDVADLPENIYTGSKEYVQGFLQSEFSINGTVVNPPESNPEVSLRCPTGEHAQEIQQILLNFNVFSEITKTQDSVYLTITGESIKTFKDEIGFLKTESIDSERGQQSKKLESIINSFGDEFQSDEFSSPVTEVTNAGTETVYDLVEPDTHSFIANGIVSHNCGEQPLSEYEACNLGHINLSTLAAEDVTDWRVWWDEHKSEYDSIEDAIPDYFEENIRMDEFNERIKVGTHFLENVVTMSDFPVNKISERVQEMRKIGLGIMGLAQLYVQLGLRYGSEPANELADVLMTHINHESKSVSQELAKERGVFEAWEDSKYANPTEYKEWFEKQTGENAEDWQDGYPIRNHNTTTIAPTGSTSMLGNTTGGCEPMYNVAYYKNVSDDVQGDEMLVEFDDYFLRVLEENDIDVEAVKKEAEQLMDSNEFDGVQDLETVPDAIGELFVVTSDLTGLEHASIQCALQNGVDSAISKTVNFPNSATPDDMREVYEYVFENGGKGVTVYRDGTRSKQVLTTRADNTEFSDSEDLAEAVEDKATEDAEFRTELIKIVEELASTEELKEDEKSELLDSLNEETTVNESLSIAEYRKRDDVLTGATIRVSTGYGTLYVTLNEDIDGNLFEVFCEIGKAGGYTDSYTEALSRMISMSLRYGVPPKRIIKHLDGIRSPKVGWNNGDQIDSIPDGVATAIEKYIEEGGVLGILKAQRDGELDGLDATSGNSESNIATKSDEDIEYDSDNAGEIPECPECGSAELYFSEGCKTCESCGWSKC